MYKLLLPVVGVASMMACDTAACVDDTGTPDVDECADSGGDTGDTNNNTDPAITVDWGGSAVTIELENFTTSGFDFGMAETADPDDGWFGEDCLNGTASYNYCHQFNSTTASLGYVDTLGGVSESQTTLFDAGFQTRITYVVTVDGGDCFVWGHDPSYYLDSESFAPCENWN